jgi:hypothetical protein
MRRILPFLMLTVVAACALPQQRWEKEGADEALTTNDLGYCRAAARNEAFATYPYGYGTPFYGFRRWPNWNDDRFFAQTRLTSFCMRAKGYQLVTVQPPQASSGPPPPPAPTPEK